MKKIICALVGCLISFSAFADNHKSTSGNLYQVHLTTSGFPIERAFIYNINSDLKKRGEPTLESDVITAMLAKYDELAKSEFDNFVEYNSVTGKYEATTALEGTRNLTYSDLEKICEAGGLNTKELCSRYLINPVYNMYNFIDFYNVCESRDYIYTQKNLNTDVRVETGGNNHCIDDVFAKSYSKRVVYDLLRMDGKTRGEYGWQFHSDDQPLGAGKLEKGRLQYSSNNPYAQDVKLPEWTALGFAIEYIKRNYKDHALCSTVINNDWINCSSVDMKNFYTFKFKSTQNDSDSSITENIIKGICAMHNVRYLEGYNACDMKMCPDTELTRKFALNTSMYSESHSGYKMCMMARKKMEGDTGINYYEGNKDLTYGLDKVQVIMESDLDLVLRKYITSNGIEVKSLDCDYASIDYANSLLESAVSHPDDLLRCKLNGKEVDFVFDDLYESKEYARNAGFAGMACLTAPADLAEQLNEKFSTKFDGKNCIGPGKDICNAMNYYVPGGTEWDAKSDKCKLTDAYWADSINKKIQFVVDGLVITAAIVSGGGLVFILVTGVTTLGVSLAQEWIDDAMNNLPNDYAKNFLMDAAQCNIVGEKEYKDCDEGQKYCAKSVLKKFYGTLGFILDGISNDTANHVVDAAGVLSSCLTDAEVEEIAKKSEIDPGIKGLQALSMATMIVGFVNPNGVTKFTMFSKFPKLMRTLQKINKINIKTLTKLSRIDASDIKNAADLNKYIKDIEAHGFSAITFFDKTGTKQYFQVVEKGSEAEKAVLKYKANPYFDSFLDDFKKNGKNRGMQKHPLSRAELDEINKQLSKEGVELIEGTSTAGKDVWMFKSIKKGTKIFPDVKGVIPVKETPDGMAVYLFVDPATSKSYYVKFTTDAKEIERTKKAYKILSKRNSNVSSPRVVNDNSQEVRTFMEQLGVTPRSKKVKGFIMEETRVTQNDAVPMLMDYPESVDKAKEALRGQPITWKEQQEILDAVQDLNKNGIKHGDLLSNMFVTRGEDGKLYTSIIDFEPWSAGTMDDIGNVKGWFKDLAEHGLAEDVAREQKILSIRDEVSAAHQIDYDKLSAVDKEWYKLWQDYAPKNQTFDEFKAMADGDLNKMKEISKEWKTNAQWKQESEILYNKHEELNNLMDKYGIDALPDDPDKLAKIYQQYPDIAQLDSDIKKIENDAIAVSNYSTYDSKMTQVFEDAKVKKAMPSQWKIAEEFQLKNLGNVAQERVEVMKKILSENKELSAKIEPKVWTKLSEKERLDVMQKIVDEYGHLIDHQVPNSGALGAQYANYTKQIYSNDPVAGYRVALTEQSSYKIGGKTGGTINKKINKKNNIKTVGSAILGGVGVDAAAAGIHELLSDEDEDENEAVQKTQKDKKDN